MLSTNDDGFTFSVFGWNVLVMRGRDVGARPFKRERWGWGWIATWGPLTLWAVRPTTRRQAPLYFWLRSLPRHFRRVRVWLSLRPVYVGFYGYCCDTGPYTWTHAFRWGLETHYGWRRRFFPVMWPGRAACEATTWEALDGVSDGPTDWSVITRADYEAIREDMGRPRLTWDEQAAERWAEDEARAWG